MVLYAPHYYKKFRCIADKCRHSCCIGWEIDIDSETYEKYKVLNGNLSEKLNKNIALETDGTVHFILDKNERCPMLNYNGLCSIILNLGEDSLCQICNDHPRFRNFYENRTEIGLGMCCEAAANLILSETEKFQLIPLTDCADNEIFSDDEKYFFNAREKIFAVLQDRSLTVESRAEKLLDMFSVSLPAKTATQWAEIFLKLERLDNQWDECLLKLKNANVKELDYPLPNELSTTFEQLLIYFAYRHCAKYFDGFEFPQIAEFIALSFNIIKWLCILHMNENGNLTINDIAEIARMYSAEIEYSEENTNELFEVLYAYLISLKQ